MTPVRGAVSHAPGTAEVLTGAGETNRLLGATKKESQGSRRNESVRVYDLATVWAEFQRAGPLQTSGAHGSMHVDVLVIDAEGAEALILGVMPGEEAPRPLHDLPSPPPSLVLFEHVHLSRADQRAIDAHLVRQGYVHLADLKNRDPRGAHMPPANRLYGRLAARRAVPSP